MGVPGEAAAPWLTTTVLVPGLGGASERLCPVPHPNKNLAVWGCDSKFAESRWGLRCLSPTGRNLGPGGNLG